MALKKSELYRSLWASCDALRGGMDASQYKDYVLTLLFVKYVSDKYAGDPYALIQVPEGGSFEDMVRLKGDKEIGDRINKIIGRLAEANDLKGVIDVADFNDEDKLGKGKDMVDRLSSLIGIFENLDLSANRADGDDLLGDAYEYLMRHFATESGKSKGQFYTPAEVSRIMAKLLGIGEETTQDQSVYDPACGSGSLLLKVAHEAPHGLSIYGQEMDVATAALARMNMILHDAPTAEIWQGNTLADPHWKDKEGNLKTFNYIVANPPFSYKSWCNGLDPEHDPYHRFEYGIPPAKNGDYAWLLHIVTSLKSTGKAAVILPHGVLFRGGAEGEIRRNLIRRGLIKAIIGLPANLFYGTGIPACIIVVDKENAASRENIFMIDASGGYRKDGNKNRLRERDIHRIIDIYRRGEPVERYARPVPLEEIEANEYNLNIPRYIDSSEPEDLQDIDAHLHGGIPERDIDALSEYWEAFPSLRRELFKPGKRPGYSEAVLEVNQIAQSVREHKDFQAFAAQLADRLQNWSDLHRVMLMELDEQTQPKALLETLSESLLEAFKTAPLIDPYAIYQTLTEYWEETMQDDVYTVVQEGWIDAVKPRELIVQKGQKSKITPDLVIGKKRYLCDVIPPDLIIARYFAAEREEIDRLRSEAEAAERELESFIEEHGGEEGYLDDVMNGSGKVVKGELKKRIKEIQNNPEFAEEYKALVKCEELMEKKAAADKKLKEAQKGLEEAVFAHYSKLDESEIKTLLVDDKWLHAVAQSVTAETERVSRTLASRIKTLEERYAEPLPKILEEVEALTQKVDAHLRQMGYAL